MEEREPTILEDVWGEMQNYLEDSLSSKTVPNNSLHKEKRRNTNSTWTNETPRKRSEKIKATSPPKIYNERARKGNYERTDESQKGCLSGGRLKKGGEGCRILPPKEGYVKH